MSERLHEALSTTPTTWETFEPHVGSQFAVCLEPESEPVANLTLTSAEKLKWTRPAGDPAFALIFSGPPDVALQQGLYWLCHPSIEGLGVFLVPVSGNSEKREYQAVFN